jgi:hypothetical protein
MPNKCDLFHKHTFSILCTRKFVFSGKNVAQSKIHWTHKQIIVTHMLPHNKTVLLKQMPSISARYQQLAGAFHLSASKNVLF